MKIAKIADLANLADGSIIGEMSVQVKTAFPPKTGEGKFGPWRVQAVILKDSTGEVRASFWIKDEMKDLVGQTITIKSQGGAKGLQGLSVKFNSHSNTNELNVTDKAAIIDSAAGAFRQAETAAKVNTAISSGQGGGTPADARRLIFQRAQLYVECAKAAKWAAGEAGITDTEGLQALRSSLFISADKANLWNVFPATSAKPVPAEVPDEIPMGGDDIDEFSKEAGW
jgi:hypothetical protein